MLYRQFIFIHNLHTKISKNYYLHFICIYITNNLYLEHMPFSHEIYYLYNPFFAKRIRKKKEKESNAHGRTKGLFLKELRYKCREKHENGSIMNEFNWWFSFYGKSIVYIYCVKWDCEWKESKWFKLFLLI